MSTPILGILSIVLGGISLIPFFGVFALIGLILGVLGIVKKQYSTAIIGTVVSVVGIATSPIVWATMQGGFCKVAHCQFENTSHLHADTREVIKVHPPQPIQQATPAPTKCHVDVSYEIIGTPNQNMTLHKDVEGTPMDENTCRTSCNGASGKVGGDIRHNTAVTMACYYEGKLILQRPE
jgi:hypothetical protein